MPSGPKVARWLSRHQCTAPGWQSGWDEDGCYLCTLLQVEEAYIGAEELCERLQQDGESVLGAEALVAQALNFDLITHSPYLPLAGLFAVC